MIEQQLTLFEWSKHALRMRQIFDSIAYHSVCVECLTVSVDIVRWNRTSETPPVDSIGQ